MFMKLQSGHFSSLQMSLYACKAGLLRACRPIICIDGCHIKTKYGGQLLTVVGLDPNDCIFPIDMAYVEVEGTETWKWFLRTLIQDLGYEKMCILDWTRKLVHFGKNRRYDVLS